MSDEWEDTPIPDDLQAQIDERFDRAEAEARAVADQLFELAKVAAGEGWDAPARLYRDAAKLALRGEGVEMQRTIAKANELVNRIG